MASRGSRRLLALAVLATSPGCFGILQGEYGNSLPLTAGEGSLELRGGLGDLREDRLSMEAGLDLGVASHLVRAGLGPGVLGVLWPDFHHRLTPTLRLHVPLEVVRESGQTLGEVSPALELGLLLFSSSETRHRNILTVGLQIVDHLRLDGGGQEPVLMLGVGLGLSTSIGPLS